MLNFAKTIYSAELLFLQSNELDFMPRTKNTQSKQKPSKSMEAALWESCNKLRGAVEPAEYKHVVLSLIFLKYAGDRFEQRKQELVEQGLKEYIDQVEFYTAENVFYLTP